MKNLLFLAVILLLQQTNTFSYPPNIICKNSYSYSHSYIHSPSYSHSYSNRKIVSNDYRKKILSATPSDSDTEANNIHHNNNNNHTLINSAIDSSIAKKIRKNADKKAPNLVQYMQNSSFFGDSQLQKDYKDLKIRLDRVEKSLASTQLIVGKPKTAVGSFVDSLQAGKLQMNAKSVELCAILSFFIIGSVIGASLLDRLWLLGGIGGAWWASGAVYRDTRGGLFARRIAVQVVEVLQDLQEKYNQAIIFYRTGKLAYVTKKWWDQYDKSYGVTDKMNEMKKLASKRATEFNSMVEEGRFGAKLSDFWKAMEKAPSSAKKLDRKYGVTTSFFALGRGVYNAAGEGVGLLTGRRSEIKTNKRTSGRGSIGRKSTSSVGGARSAGGIYDGITSALSAFGLTRSEVRGVPFTPTGNVNIWGGPFSKPNTSPFGGSSRRYGTSRNSVSIYDRPSFSVANKALSLAILLALLEVLKKLSTLFFAVRGV